MTVITWMLAIPLLGLCTGLRTMTPIALVCWYARLGFLPLEGTWASWIANPITIGVFTVLAVGEYVGDKLPMTPSRVTPFPLISRIAFGGLVGALVATSLSGSEIEGTILGIIGAVIGAFGGYNIRRHLTLVKGWPDLTIALVEDGITIVLTFFAMGIATGG